MMIKLADQRETLFSEKKNTDCVTSYKTVGTKSVWAGRSDSEKISQDNFQT